MMRDANTATVARPGGALDREGWADLARRLWSRPYRQAVAWSALVSLLAYGFAMTNFVLAGDDWFAVFPSATLDTDFALLAGRWLMPLLWVGAGNAFVPFFSFAVALALLTVAGVLAAAAWGMTRSWAVFSVVSLFVVNPLYTDLLNPYVSFSLAMVCATLGGWVLLRWRAAPAWRVAVAAVLLVLCLASYQPTALAVAVVAVGWEARRVASRDPRYCREAIRRWLEITGAVVAGVILYLLSVAVAWWVTGTDSSAARPGYDLTGGYPTTLGEILAVLRYGLGMTGRFWSGGTTLYPAALKWADLALVAAGLLVAGAMAGRAKTGTRWGRVGAQVRVLALGLVSLALPFTVLFLRDEPQLRGSAFTTVGLVVGFWAGFLLEHVPVAEPRGRRWLAGIAGAGLVLVTVLGCAHQINKGYFGLHLANQRDLANASRMLSVMEQMPEFGEGAEIRIQLVGLVRFHVAAEPFSNRVPDTPGVSIVDCSGLACQDRLVSMLNLIGGGARPFVVRGVAGDPDAAEVLAGMPVWPEPGSIRFLKGTFVVKGS